MVGSAPRSLSFAAAPDCFYFFPGRTNGHRQRSAWPADDGEANRPIPQWHRLSRSRSRHRHLVPRTAGRKQSPSAQMTQVAARRSVRRSPRSGRTDRRCCGRLYGCRIFGHPTYNVSAFSDHNRIRELLEDHGIIEDGEAGALRSKGDDCARERILAHKIKAIRLAERLVRDGRVEAAEFLRLMEKTDAERIRTARVVNYTFWTVIATIAVGVVGITMSLMRLSAWHLPARRVRITNRCRGYPEAANWFCGRE